MSTLLRCVRNPANSLGLHVGVHTLYSHPSCCGFKHPENGVEVKAGSKPEAETEPSTRAVECRTTREAERAQDGKRRRHWVHRSVLSLLLWSEWNRFLRKSKHSVLPTAERHDFLREPIRRTFVDFRDVIRFDDRQCTWDWDFHCTIMYRGRLRSRTFFSYIFFLLWNKSTVVVYVYKN